MTDTASPAAAAARAVAFAIARHALTAAGTALVARGLVDQDTVNTAIPPIADQLVGAAIVAVSAAWSGKKAWLTHTRLADAWDALRGNTDATAYDAAVKPGAAG